MQIAIISDIHDHRQNLQRVLKKIVRCDVLLCCGDLCSPFIIKDLASGFNRPIHIVFGNNDADLFRITSIAQTFPQFQLHGELAELELGERKIAMNHFDNIATHLADCGNFDLVCYGHNHTASIDKRGDTILLNPGEVMGGLSGNGVSYALYDCVYGVAELKFLDE